MKPKYFAVPDTEDAESFDETRAQAQFLRDRDEWIDYVNQHDQLSHSTARIAVFLARRMNATDRCSWWRVKEMVKALPVSTRSVTTALKELDSEGLIILRRVNRRGGYRYYLKMPWDFEAQNLPD